MPILGIFASQMTGKLYDPGAFDSIATTTVGAGGASSVTFSSIPSGYTHLQVRIIARSTLATTQDNAFFRFNSDTGSNYAFHYIYGTGSIAAAGASTGATGNLLDGEPGASIASGIFATSIVDILDYASTTKLKTSRILNGWDSNGNGNIALHSGLWQNTAAINSITFYTGSNFAQYSSFALYGIKGN